MILAHELAHGLVLAARSYAEGRPFARSSRKAPAVFTQAGV